MNLIENKFIVHYEQPFYNYINGSWTKGTNNFCYSQNYTRGSENPLSQFISEGTKNLDDFIYSYFKSYGIAYQGITNNFRNVIIHFFNDFYNNFMNNKYIIDTELTPEGTYKWNGGITEVQISLNTTISIINTKNFQSIKNQKDFYYHNPIFIYKLNIGAIDNQRW